jgi:hypothetical protein
MPALRREETDDLRIALQSLPGVAEIDLSSEAGKPRVRVYLEESADAGSVAAAVRQVLAPRGLRAKEAAPVGDGPTPPAAEPKAPPRSANGIPDRRARPSHVVPVTPPRSGVDGLLRIGGLPANGDVAKFPVAAGKLERIAIEATADGFTVRAVDSLGRDTSMGVGEGEGALDAAIVGAVARLIGYPAAPRVVALNLQEMDGSSVMSVVIESPAGQRFAGAVVADASLPFALGQATWMALEGVG